MNAPLKMCTFNVCILMCTFKIDFFYLYCHKTMYGVYPPVIESRKKYLTYLNDVSHACYTQEQHGSTFPFSSSFQDGCWLQKVDTKSLRYHFIVRYFKLWQWHYYHFTSLFYSSCTVTRPLTYFAGQPCLNGCDKQKLHWHRSKPDRSAS